MTDPVTVPKATEVLRKQVTDPVTDPVTDSVTDSKEKRLKGAI